MPAAPEPSRSVADRPTESELTGRIAAGDEQAFGQFYAQWFGPTLALARAISRRDEQWCLDVVQDVMLVCARRLPALDGMASLRAWMTRTVVNAVTDRTRAEARRRRREQAVAEAVASRDGEPWHALADRERSAWLVQSVAALPAAEQALLEARFGAASTVAATADAMGISSDAAHGRLRRALDKLRQKAAQWFHDEQ